MRAEPLEGSHNEERNGKAKAGSRDVESQAGRPRLVVLDVRGVLGERGRGGVVVNHTSGRGGARGAGAGAGAGDLGSVDATGDVTADLAYSL